MQETMNKMLAVLTAVAAMLASACASGPNPPAYAFIVSDELPDLFLATLPGVRAKEFFSDTVTRSSSNRIDLPSNWSGTTGGSPGKALEIFVLSGDLQLADIDLETGGYAYVPPGSIGFNLHSTSGARVLYFLSDFDENAVIRAPLILDSRLVDWQPTDTIGVLVKDLRVDPGSGEHTRLLRFEPEATMPWQSSSQQLEGYLISGQFQDSECVDGEPYTAIYLPGGYFVRPSGSVHGGPAAKAISEATWYLRQPGKASIDVDAECAAAL